MRLGRPDRHDRRALGPDEVAVVVDPAAIAVRVELADEQDPRVVAVLAPVGQQRLERALLGDRQVGPVEVGRLEQDVEVAHGPEPRRDLAQAVAVALRPAGPERRPEDPPGRPLPAGRDAHRVELLGVGAGARARLAREHPGEVEAHDLAAGLGDVVVGGDAGRPADDQVRVRRDRLRRPPR